MNVELTRITSTVQPYAGDMAVSNGETENSYDNQRQGVSLMAMIVCSSCKHMVYSPVDRVECVTLYNGGRISRHCHNCRTATSWMQFESHSPDCNKPLLYQTIQPDRV